MRDPEALISTEQLAAALGRTDLRIYDCTTYLEPPPPGSDDPYVTVAGLKTFEEAHIPGADFLDLQRATRAFETVFAEGRLPLSLRSEHGASQAWGRASARCSTASAPRCGRHASGGC